ncbi:hypothetical protein AVEN_188978-1 [Araneus ventricosus]|uniref:Uncharacterized protein n=1 Tax=Araneus ventricosus TaxID=182803 RepID=A0A4Y2VLI6_ARAVE|nr:hypothetical protein AVEN_188978-1 [Araneus ventricosus]
MSSYQSMPPQMPPQSIPAQPQPQHTGNGANAIPIIDPKTGKNVMTVDKNAEDSSSRPRSEKESENSDSNICVQFATQVAAVLNDSRSDIASKQPQPVRIDTMCSHENEGMRVQETPVGELVDENIIELPNIEDLSEVEFTDSRNLICNEEIAGPYCSKDIGSNSINESESGATKIVDSLAKTEDREQSVFEVPVESSVPDTEESVISVKLNSTSNAEKLVGYNETKKINNVKSVIEIDCSNSTQESVQPLVTGVKELVLPSNNEVLESSAAVSTKVPEKVLSEGKETMCSHENEGMEKRRKGKKMKKRYKELQLNHLYLKLTKKINPIYNVEKMIRFNETKKIISVKSVKESGCSNSTQESVQPEVVVVKELVLSSNNAGDSSARPNREK